MIKKGIIVTAIFIVSTFIQLVSQIIVTRLFGAKLDLDIFLAAVTIPTIIVTVIYGTLNDAFLPIYGEQKAKDKNNADSYFVSHLLSLSIISFLIAWVLGFLSVPISQFLYNDRGVMFVKDVAVQMSYMFYSIPFSVIATIFGSYYYLHKHFNRFPLAQAIGSIANLLLIIFFAPILGVWSLVLAFVINILIQTLFVIPPFKIFNSPPTFRLPDLSALFIAWIPLIISNFALRSDSIIIRSFGTSLPVGYLVYLNLVSKIFMLATGMMTIGIQVLQLPHLVEYINGKQFKRAIIVVNKSKIVSIAVSVITTVFVLLLAPVAVYLLFVGGKFTKHDADITISLLPFFVLPAIGWGISSVFFQPLIALKKQFQLGILNLVALLVAWITGTIIKIYFGPLFAITASLIILLFIGIIGSEILWQKEKLRLLSAH